MKRCVAAIMLVICLMTVMLSAGCGKKKDPAKPSGDLTYSDDYQAAAQVDYEDIKLQVRTSSAVYFAGSIISVTAVIENKSENYYLVSPEGNGFDLIVSADGYDLMPAGTVSPSDIPLVLEPNGSVSMTREYKSKVIAKGQELPLWECEPVAGVNVKISEPAVSRQAALDMPLSDSKSAKTSFVMYGTGEKP